MPLARTFASGDLADTTEALRRGAERYDFDVTSRRIAGVDASCLRTVAKAGFDDEPELGPDGTLCVSPDGVPLLVDRPAARLEAVEYRTEVDDDDVRLPAEVDRSGAP